MARATHRRSCPLCEAMCGLELEHDGTEVLRVSGDGPDPLSAGYLCPKGAQIGALHGDPDRLRRPLRRRGDTWDEVPWDEALDEAATMIHAVQQAHGRDAFGTYLGNPNVHNYGAMLYGPDFLRTLGSRSRFSATSVDQLPHMLAAHLMFGHQLLIPVPDVDRTSYMVILGANPVVSNGSLMSAPNMKARLEAILSRGGEVVVLDPRRSETAKLASSHHFIRPGTDAHFLAAVARELAALRADAGGALPAYVRGADSVGEHLAAWTPEASARVTGVAPEVVREVAAKLFERPRSVCYGRIGICVQAFGGVNAWLLNVINLLAGSLDVEGGAMFAAPAFDIIGGPRALGLGPGSFGRWKSRVRGLPEFSSELPVSTMAEEIDTPGEGQIRGLLTSAGNPVLSTPNGRRLERALEGLDAMISVDFYLNETTRHAHLILPPTSPLEHGHYDVAFHALAVRNTARYSPALFPPSAEQRHDWQIFTGLERRLLRRRGAGGGARLGVKAREALTPEGILRLGLAFGPYGWRGEKRDVHGRRVTLPALKSAEHGVDLGPLSPCLPGRLPQRRDGAPGHVTVCPEVFVEDLRRLRASLDVPAATGDGLALIGRRELRSNNSWMHNVPKLVAGSPRCTLHMHPDDAAARSLREDAWVEVESRVGRVRARLKVHEDIMPGIVSLPHGYGHQRDGVRLRVAATVEGASANDLTDESVVDEATGNAVLNGVPVTVRLADPASA